MAKVPRRKLQQQQQQQQQEDPLAPPVAAANNEVDQDEEMQDANDDVDIINNDGNNKKPSTNKKRSRKKRSKATRDDGTAVESDDESHEDQPPRKRAAVRKTGSNEETLLEDDDSDDNIAVTAESKAAKSSRRVTLSPPKQQRSPSHSPNTTARSSLGKGKKATGPGRAAPLSLLAPEQEEKEMPLPPSSQLLKKKKKNDAPLTAETTVVQPKKGQLNGGLETGEAPQGLVLEEEETPPETTKGFGPLRHLHTGLLVACWSYVALCGAWGIQRWWNQTATPITFSDFSLQFQCFRNNVRHTASYQGLCADRDPSTFAPCPKHALCWGGTVHDCRFGGKSLSLPQEQAYDFYELQQTTTPATKSCHLTPSAQRGLDSVLNVLEQWTLAHQCRDGMAPANATRHPLAVWLEQQIPMFPLANLTNKLITDGSLSQNDSDYEPLPFDLFEVDDVENFLKHASDLSSDQHGNSNKVVTLINMPNVAKANPWLAGRATSLKKAGRQVVPAGTPLVGLASPQCSLRKRWLPLRAQCVWYGMPYLRKSANSNTTTSSKVDPDKEYDELVAKRKAEARRRRNNKKLVESSVEAEPVVEKLRQDHTTTAVKNVSDKAAKAKNSDTPSNKWKLKDTKIKPPTTSSGTAGSEPKTKEKVDAKKKKKTDTTAADEKANAKPDSNKKQMKQMMKPFSIPLITSSVEKAKRNAEKMKPMMAMNTNTKLEKADEKKQSIKSDSVAETKQQPIQDNAKESNATSAIANQTADTINKKSETEAMKSESVGASSISSSSIAPVDQANNTNTSSSSSPPSSADSKNRDGSRSLLPSINDYLSLYPMTCLVALVGILYLQYKQRQSLRRYRQWRAKVEQMKQIAKAQIEHVTNGTWSMEGFKAAVLEAATLTTSTNTVTSTSASNTGSTTSANPAEPQETSVGTTSVPASSTNTQPGLQGLHIETEIQNLPQDSLLPRSTANTTTSSRARHYHSVTFAPPSPRQVAFQR